MAAPKAAIVDGLAAGGVAAVVSGAPSTLYALATGASPLAAILAAGTLVCRVSAVGLPLPLVALAGARRDLARLGRPVKPAADDDGERIGGEALLAALIAQPGVTHKPPVPLDRDGASTDHDGVGLRTQVVKERVVGLVADRGGAAVDRRGRRRSPPC